MYLEVPGESGMRSRGPTPPPVPPPRRLSDSPLHNKPVLHRKSQLEAHASSPSVIEDESSIELSQPRRYKGAYISIASEEGSGHCPPKPFTRKRQIWGYWRRPLRHLAIFLTFSFIALPPIIATNTLYSRSTIKYGDFSFYDCSLRGFEHKWSFTHIDIQFRSFSYGQAKAIDLAWNWLVGRGIAAFMTFVCYRVFTDALMRAVELTALPYELFASLAFYPTRLDTVWQLLKGLSLNGGWRVRAILVWLLISIIYLSALPSLLDACSGYESAYSTDFVWPNRSTTNVDDLGGNGTWFYTEDGKVSFDGSTDNYKNVTFALIDDDFTFALTDDDFPSAPTDDDFPSASNEDSLTQDSGTKSLYKELYFFEDQELNQSWWDWAHEYPFVDMNGLDYSSTTFDSKHHYWYIANQSNYQCIALNGEYKWGFSYEWVIVVTAIHGAWLLGLWILWVDADTNSQLCKKGRRMGLWRAIADLSEAMREDLGSNFCAYSSPELLDALRKKGRVKYYVGKRVDGPKHIGLSSQRRGPFKLEWDLLYGKED